MSQTVTLTCDNCAADLLITHYESEYRLVLAAESMGHAGGAVYSTRRRPPVDADYHFCDMLCMGHWLTENHPDLEARYQSREESRRKVAERDAQP